MTPFKIPATLGDANPDLCRRVAIEICGADDVLKNGAAVFEKERLVYDNFNPFTRIQDTKLLDKWVVGNDLNFYSSLCRHANKDDWTASICRFDSIGAFCWRVDVSSGLEPFARMVAILKAYNKINGGE